VRFVAPDHRLLQWRAVYLPGAFAGCDTESRGEAKGARNGMSSGVSRSSSIRIAAPSNPTVVSPTTSPWRRVDDGPSGIYQQLVLETDQEIQRQMVELEAADNALAKIPKRTKRLPYQRQGHEPRVFDLRRELYRIFGVDLTNVPGISAMTSQTILCEVGTDVSRFRNASAFASWLGLCPEKKISSGKVLFTKSRRVRSRVAIAFRLAARSLHHAKDYMGEFFRRICRKLGKPQAITATAHKLARIVYHLLSTREAYDESVFHKCEEEGLKRAEMRLRRQAAHLGFRIISAEEG
jgi:transposase